MRTSICFAVFLMAFYGCADTGTVEPEPPMAQAFAVHLQSGYAHTPVIVSIDHARVFQDTVSTGYVLAFAAIIPVNVTQGTHTLTVTVPDKVSKDTTFTIVDTLYAGVQYSAAARRIDVEFQKSPFFYR